MGETPQEIIRDKFSKRLIDEMADRGWSQSDLAREASRHLPSGEIARDNISNYVRGRALPNPPFLRALAKALNTTDEDLLPERGVPPSRDGGPLPSLDVRDAGDNMAYVRINRRLPWPVALEIMQLVAKAVKEED